MKRQSRRAKKNPPIEWHPKDIDDTLAALGRQKLINCNDTKGFFFLWLGRGFPNFPGPTAERVNARLDFEVNVSHLCTAASRSNQILSLLTRSRTPSQPPHDIFCLRLLPNAPTSDSHRCPRGSSSSILDPSPPPRGSSMPPGTALAPIPACASLRSQRIASLRRAAAKCFAITGLVLPPAESARFLHSCPASLLFFLPAIAPLGSRPVPHWCFRRSHRCWETHPAVRPAATAACRRKWGGGGG